MLLLENATVNGSGSGGDWKGGIGSVVCEGTFDGATVTLEAQIADGAWVACGDKTEFTAAGMASLELGYGFKLRGTISDAGASTDITLSVIRFR